MFNLPSIAATTEGLGVFAHGLSARRHANDVVKFKMFDAAATGALVVPPCAQLGGIEADASGDSASDFLGKGHRLAGVRWKTPGSAVSVRPFAIYFNNAGRHFDPSRGSSGTVAFSGTKANPLTFCLGITDRGRPAFKLTAASFAGKGDFPRFVKDGYSPGAFGDAKTLRAAKPDFPALRLGGTMESGRSLKRNAASFANSYDLLNGLRHVFSFQSNRVNSVEPNANQRRYFRCKKYTILTKLAIPSQAAHVSISMPRGAEGVTTRGCGNNKTPTSARHRSIGEEIVCSATSNWHKSQKPVINRLVKNNRTYKRYSGYDVLNISPSDVFTAAQFAIAQAAVAVSISGLEMLQNSGKEKMIDLLESRIGNAERTMENNISNDAYSNGTADGGKQIGGLQLLVSSINNSGTIGGIDASVWGFWQNNVMSFAAQGLTAGSANMQTMMNRLWLTVKRQSDRPDLCIADNTFFRYYWESLQAIQRIQSEDTGMAGFQNLKFMDMDVVADGAFQGTSAGNVSVLGGGGSWLSGSGAPSSTMYMLNTDYLFLRPHADRNMVPLDPDRFSVNQDAMVKLIAWAGNLAISNRFLQGVLTL